MKFIEGEVVPFQVIKLEQIPEQGSFFVLRHHSGRRLLLSAAVYSQYNIRAGTTIECKIERVSCTGKVYLEPMHPCYREGEVYDFKLLEGFKGGNPLVVEDCLGNRIEVQNATGTHQSAENETVTLRVGEIRRGVPTLLI